MAKTKRIHSHHNFTVIIIIAIIGGMLSITLHELLHIVLHWGEITGLHVFPNFYTVAEVIINIPDGYDFASEEFMAYTVSAIVLVATVGAIAQIYDDTDKRTVQQILFPGRKPTQLTTLARRRAVKK